MTVTWPDEQPILTDGVLLMRAWAVEDACGAGFVAADTSPRIMPLKGVDREFTILHRSRDDS
jgi:hypothetical protein